MADAGTRNSQSQTVMAYLQSNYINTAAYFTRLGTLFSFVAFFMSPLFMGGGVVAANAWYQRAFLANAATSALRLRQRINQNQLAFSRECLANLLAEDSMHYLFYSMIFVMLPPVTVALIPIFCFALLHSVSFTDTLLKLSAGPTSRPEGDGPGVPSGRQTSALTYPLQVIISKVRGNEHMILRMIAVNEVLLMIISIIFAFSGPQVLMLPILYYQFIRLRYASRRSPYCRMVFTELRMSVQQIAAHQSCPAVVSKALYFLITFVSNRAPSMPYT